MWKRAIPGNYSLNIHIKAKANIFSHGGWVTKSCLTLVTPGTAACQALSMGFSRKEYWSGLLFPSPRIFPTQGLNPHILYLIHCKQILYWLSYEGSSFIFSIYLSAIFFSLIRKKTKEVKALWMPTSPRCIRNLRE